MIYVLCECECYHEVQQRAAGERVDCCSFSEKLNRAGKRERVDHLLRGFPWNIARQLNARPFSPVGFQKNCFFHQFFCSR